MSQPDFCYTTYIKSTPEKVWEAITTAEFTKQYAGHQYVSEWKEGTTWEMRRNSDASLNVSGKVIECSPPKRLVLEWEEATKPGDVSQVTFEIERANDTVRLNVTHSKLSEYMAGRISFGWPIVLSGLKTLLETGKGLSPEWGGCRSTAA